MSDTLRQLFDACAEAMEMEGERLTRPASTASVTAALSAPGPAVG